MSGLHTVKSLSPIQAQIWTIARTLNAPRPTHQQLAAQLNKSRSFISKQLRDADSRVRKLLTATAEANWIKIDGISVEKGFLWGKSQIFQSQAYITFSPEHGVQVWYDHDATCETCDIKEQCISVVSTEAETRGIELPTINSPYSPAERANYLFALLKRLCQDEK